MDVVVIEYEELRVRALKIGRDRYLVVANGPAAAAAGVHIDPEHRYRESFSALLDEEFRRTAGPRVAVHERIRALGERLFALLFPGVVQACLFESDRRADQHGRRLRIRFELAPEINDIPMEILWGPHGKLAGHPRFSLTRTVQGSALSPRRLPTATSPPEKFRVLVVVADPHRGVGSENRLLDLGAEVSALQEALTAGPRRAAVTVETLGWPRSAHRFPRPTLANLRAALARHPEMPCAVVVLGHGTGGDGTRGGEIFLETKDGSPDPVAGERLAADLAAAPGVRLVVLNLCAGAQAGPVATLHSAVAHELIARGIPAVVAMQADVSNTAATCFTPALFTKIAANGSVDEAVAAARQDMVNARDETTLEWATPVLMLHHLCRHSWLFKAVKVVKGTAPVDPLARGQQAIDEVDNPPDGVVQIDALVEASRCARLLGDWPQVVRFADMGRDEHEPLEWLAQEARLELALDQYRAICEILSQEDDPDKAASLLDALRPMVPDEMFDCLVAEVHRAAKAFTAWAAATESAAGSDWEAVVAYCDEILADLPDGYRDATVLRETAVLELDLVAVYRDAQQHRESELWADAEGAYDHILGRSPNGYRDALGWRDYCRARQAEKVADLSGAIIAYDAASGVGDADGRGARCRARQAEVDIDWEAAVAQYELAQRHGVDVGLDLRYSTGRLGVARGEWPAAAAAFRGLPEHYRDARDWARLTAGQVALNELQWSDALDALGGLADGFHDGEVGRIRGPARAELAAAQSQWAAVVEALRGLDDDNIRVCVLLATAQGQLAEDRGDWPAAVAAYRRVPQPAPEMAALLVYVTGRVAEVDGDWAQALAAYQRLPAGVRDASLRHHYVEGRAAEDAENWNDAQRCYRLLPAGFEDAGSRAGYSRVRSAVERQDWPILVQSAEALGLFRNAPLLALYGRARMAETAEDWSLAAGLFEQCAACEDAEVRAGYARGRALEDGGRWSQAQAIYRELPDDHRDVSARRARLSVLLHTLGWADGLGDASLVPDPSAAGRDDFPYRVLAPLGIGPGSSMQDVKGVGMRVLRGNQAAARRVAAELRLWGPRLAVDADLYPLRDAATLRRALHALTVDEPTDPFGQLCAAVPDDAPLLAMLHLGREQAIDAWEDRLRSDPGDMATAHCLAIAHRWAARDLDRAGAREHGRVAWQRCIGMWVAVLGNEAYWEQWRRERSVCYRLMVDVPEMRKLRGVIIDNLTGELDRIASQHAQDDRPALAEQYRALSLAVRVEILGRDVLAEAGGMPPSRGSGVRFLGGPSYLRAVDLSDTVAQLVADLVRCADDALSEQDPTSGDQDPLSDATVTSVTPELITRLCAVFSRLGPALALLESGRPERALAMLPDLHRRSLAEVTDDPRCTHDDRAGSAVHRQSCPTCRRFLADDPAYLYLGGRDTRLLQDSARIAIRCHLTVARAAVRADDRAEVDSALRAVGAALRLASTAGLAARARRDVVGLVTESAETLSQSKGSRGQRLDRAVELVARVRAELGLGNDEQIKVAHAETLYHRAQWIVMGDDQGGVSADLDRAIADLREAIQISSSSLMARVGLAHTLVQRSAERPRSGRQKEAGAEALAIVTEGLHVAPGHVPLLEALVKVASHLRQLVYRALSPAQLMDLNPSESLPNESRNDAAIRLAKDARRAFAAGDVVTGLLFAVDAVLADPKEPLARDALVAIVTAWTAEPPDVRSI